MHVLKLTIDQNSSGDEDHVIQGDCLRKKNVRIIHFSKCPKTTYLRSSANAIKLLAEL